MVWIWSSITDMSLSAVLKSAYAKPVVHLLCLVPFSSLVWAAFNDGLGANPVEKLTFEMGLRKRSIALANQIG